jgi:hypothetical protein
MTIANQKAWVLAGWRNRAVSSKAVVYANVLAATKGSPNTAWAVRNTP